MGAHLGHVLSQEELQVAKVSMDFGLFEKTWLGSSNCVSDLRLLCILEVYRVVDSCCKPACLHR